MTKLSSSLRNMFLSLTGTCVVAGAILAMVNNVTKSPIALSKKAKLEDAIKAVVPPFDNVPSDEAYMSAISDGDSLKIYPAKKNGQLVGVAIESNTHKGFAGEIKVIVGLDAAGRLINYNVLEHAETPGLGSKMEEWFRTDKNQQNILGKDLSQGPLKVKKNGGEVDAITAATISSTAFLDAINRAYAAFSGKGDYSDATSGATRSRYESSDERTSEPVNQPDTVILHNKFMETGNSKDSSEKTPEDFSEKTSVIQHEIKRETKDTLNFIPKDTSNDISASVQKVQLPADVESKATVDSIAEGPKIKSEDTLSSQREAADETSPVIAQPDTITTQKGGDNEKG
jgi:electron transport complex protein RnfG